MAEDTGHGKGDRGSYYNKWDKFAKDEMVNLEATEEEEKRKADEALGLNSHKSEAEAKDMTKREALKKVKKEMQEREELKIQEKHVITVSNETMEQTPEVIDQSRMAGKSVLVIKDCNNAKLCITAKRLTKVFIEECNNCEISFESSLLTCFSEVSHCTSLRLKLVETLSTLKLDLCTDVSVHVSAAALRPAHGISGMAEYVLAKPRIVHAGCTRLDVQGETGSGCVAAPQFSFDSDECVQMVAQGGEGEEGAAKQSASEDLAKPSNEIQWVTQWYRGAWESAQLLQIGASYLTRRELRESNARNNVVPLEVSQAGTAEAALKEAQKYKEKGNKAFGERNYMQALVEYTMAIDCAPPAASEVTEENKGKPLTAICYSNRSACALKLGRLEDALKDAESCLELSPEFVKGLFRKGMALHALNRWMEALVVLGKATKLEPKNKQIKEALQFAEMRMRKAAQKAAQR